MKTSTDLNPLLEPNPIEINGKNFVLSKFPSVIGREIVAKYPLSMIPKLGDYAVNEETMLKLMSFVGIDLGEGRILRMNNRALVDNHTGDWETLALVEKNMMEYNCSFLSDGLPSNVLEGLAQTFQQWISGILTGLSVGSSEQDKPPSTS